MGMEGPTKASDKEILNFKLTFKLQGTVNGSTKGKGHPRKCQNTQKTMEPFRTVGNLV